MKYTEALEAIRADRGKRFLAFNAKTDANYILFAEEFSEGFFTVEMAESYIDSRVSYLSFDMMDLDWQEERLSGLQRLDRDYEEWSERNA